MRFCVSAVAWQPQHRLQRDYRLEHNSCSWSRESRRGARVGVDITMAMMVMMMTMGSWARPVSYCKRTRPRMIMALSMSYKSLRQVLLWIYSCCWFFPLLLAGVELALFLASLLLLFLLAVATIVPAWCWC